MCFTTLALSPFSGIPFSRAAMPIKVIMQLANEVERRSVGLKASPRP